MEQESKSMEIQTEGTAMQARHMKRLCSARPECTQDATIETDIGWLCNHHLEVAQAIMRGEQRLIQADADHAAAMKAAQDAIDMEKRALLKANAALREDAERMRVMREALEKAKPYVLKEHTRLWGNEVLEPWSSPACLCVAEAMDNLNAALASTAPVAANMQPPTNDVRLRIYESDEI